MQNLTSKQRAIVWAALLIALGMFLYPPVFSPGHSENSGRSVRNPAVTWVGAKSGGYKPIINTEGYSIDYTRLLIQYALLGGFAWVGIMSLKPKA